MAEIRPYQQGDLEQLSALANAHIAVATPGFSVPAAWIAARLERNPDEHVTDPWVAERVTLVAVERERVVAAAQLHRYADEARVSDSLRGVGEIAWLFALPSAPAAGEALVHESVARLRAWSVRRVLALGGGLGPTTYGVPDAWPHVAALLATAGFGDACVQEEVVLAAALDDLRPAPALDGVELVRVAFDEGAELRARARQRDARQACGSSCTTRPSCRPWPAGARSGGSRSARRTAARASAAGSSRGAPSGSGCAAATGCCARCWRPTRRAPARSGGRSACSR